MGDALRVGDGGQTRLGSGTRVDKDAFPVEVMGTLDELSGWIGVVAIHARSNEVRAVLDLVQRDLQDLVGQVGVPGTPLLSGAHLARIEERLGRMGAAADMSGQVTLPNGTPGSAFACLARAVCQRAERRLYSLSEISRHISETISGNFGLPYLNRLSDLLFVVAQLENQFTDSTANR